MATAPVTKRGDGPAPSSPSSYSARVVSKRLSIGTSLIPATPLLGAALTASVRWAVETLGNVAIEPRPDRLIRLSGVRGWVAVGQSFEAGVLIGNVL